MTELTYFDCINAFSELLKVNPPSSNAQLLYHTLLMEYNNARWQTVELHRTNSYIGGLCGLGDKALSNARNELKQLGLIDFTSAKKKPTKYTLLVVKNATQSATQKQVNGNSKESQKKVKGRINKDIRLKSEEKDNIPPISPKGDKSAKSKFNPEVLIADFTDDLELQEALRDFVKMRKSIKKPLTTERAFKGVLNRLAELSSSTAEQVQLVNTAVERNWLTVYKSDTSNISGGKNLSPIQRLQQETLEEIIN